MRLWAIGVLFLEFVAKANPLRSLWFQHFVIFVSFVDQIAPSIHESRGRLSALHSKHTIFNIS